MITFSNKAENFTVPDQHQIVNGPGIRDNDAHRGQNPRLRKS